MSLILVFRRVVLRSPSKRLPSLGVPFTRTVTSNEGLTVADLERRIAQLDRRIRAIEEDHNYPKKVTTSPLYEYVSAMRLNTRSTAGLGSDRGKMYKDLYKQWNKDFRKLPKVEQQIYTAKSLEKKETYKQKKEEWDRTYSGSNLALELDGLKKQRATTKAKLTRLLKEL